MYFIERRGADRQWIRELNFKNEFKAVIGARRKAISTLGTYRVVHALWPNQVVCYVDGPELTNRGGNQRGDRSAKHTHSENRTHAR